MLKILWTLSLSLFVFSAFSQTATKTDDSNKNVQQKKKVTFWATFFFW